jgi:hypothetical protein
MSIGELGSCYDAFSELGSEPGKGSTCSLGVTLGSFREE